MTSCRQSSVRNIKLSRAAMHFIQLLCTVCIVAFTWRCYGVNADQCPAQEPIYRNALKGYTFKTIQASSPFGCLYHCHYEDRCQSYNYLINEDICEMNNRTKEAKPEQFVSDPRRFYMKRGAHRVVPGSTPSLPAESCQEIKANEAGEAVSGGFWLDSISSAILAYCDMYTGAADFCFQHQCQNSASCVNGHVSYTCLCDGLWTGTYCEIAVTGTQSTHTVAPKTESESTLASYIPSMSPFTPDTQSIYTLATKTESESTLASYIPSMSPFTPDAQSIYTLSTKTESISILVANSQSISSLVPAQVSPTPVISAQLTATPTPNVTQSTATSGFKVTVVTGDVWGAGTDALLYIELIGTNGNRSGPSLIASEPGGYGGDFEGGMTDHFMVVFRDVGIIREIAIDLVSTNSYGEGWTVDKIIIQDPVRQMTYEFNGPRDVYPADDPLVLPAS